MTTQEIDEMYMRRCFQLAANGLGFTSPNPLVGCVVVRDGRVVAEGFHAAHGRNHAERDAITRCRQPELLRGATLYVNLEPCSHQGLTPPCASMLVESGIGRVVVCNDDPNPLVSGRGYALLREAGIPVTTHVLEAEGRKLNRRFFTFMEKQRPYVILKWAQSSDGFMAPAQMPCTGTDGHGYWISNSYQTLLSHRLRTTEAAILVGSQTFLDDRPQLTARLLQGRQPQRMVWDRRHRCQNMLDDTWWLMDQPDVPSLLEELYRRKMQSLIVEGGAKVLDAFLSSGLYDEVVVFQGTNAFGQGLSAPVVMQREGLTYTIVAENN